MDKILLIIFFFLTSCSISSRVTHGVQELNLYEFKNMHFVSIVLNGKKGKLLIDTGASKSILDISKSEEYGFNYIPLSDQQYIGLGGLEDIYIPFDYKVGNFAIPFLGANLSGIQSFFNRDGIYIIGVLGADYLEKNKCIIDFKKNTLYVKY